MREGFVFVMKSNNPALAGKDYSSLLRTGNTVIPESYYIIHDEKIHADDNCDSLQVVEKTTEKYPDLQPGYLVDLMWKDADEPLFFYLDKVEKGSDGSSKYGFKKIQKLHETEEYSWSYKLYYDPSDVLIKKDGFKSKNECIADAQLEKDGYCWFNATIEYWETRTTRGIA